MHRYGEALQTFYSRILNICLKIGFFLQEFSADVAKKCGEDGSKIVAMTSSVCSMHALLVLLTPPSGFSKNMNSFFNKRLIRGSSTEAVRKDMALFTRW